MGDIRHRLRRVWERRECGAFSMASTIYGAFILSLALTGFSGVSYSVAHWLHPNYAYEQAERIANNTAAEIDAAALYDSTLQSKADAGGAKSWTENVTVDNQTATATILVTPNGSIATVDVSVYNYTARALASLTARSIAPGSTI